MTLISHYLDDFTILGKAGTTECAASMSQLKETCTDLGVPIALDKCEGPATCLTILGIEIDFCDPGVAPATGQTKAGETDYLALERKKVLYAERTSITHWTAQSCL